MEIAVKQQKVTEKDLENYKKLVADNAVSVERLNSFEQAFLRQKSAVTKLKSQINLIPARKASLEAERKVLNAQKSKIERDLKDCIIKAPFTGIIQGPIADLGDRLRKGDTLCHLDASGKKELWISIGIDKSRILGKEISAKFSDLKLKYPVYSRNLGRAEQSLQTTTLIFICDGDESSLTIDEIVRLNLTGKVLKNTMIIPRSAVYNDDFIYIIADGKLKKSKINIIANIGDKSYISAPISNGTKIVTTRLRDVGEGRDVITGDK